ncbi:MAG: dTDP-glucose 4,6-dehydratase [Chloroflexota bacterium]
MRLLVTGGAGFIGSNFARYALERWPECSVIVLDALTYAGNRENLADVAAEPRFTFIHGNICDPNAVTEAMRGCTHVLNFAAETHVDRSILDGGVAVRTNIEGTRVLLEAARELGVERYLQVSTDEVYGEIETPGRSPEDAPLRPRSPYSAAKAGADLLVGAYNSTYELPTLITRGSNTYGPYQYPEKLFPLFITNALDALPLPVYGDGQQMRDWLFVEDHCAAIATVLELGAPGEVYNVGLGIERPNAVVIERILELTGADSALIRHVPDRPGHDRRYALDLARIHALGWRPQVSFARGTQFSVHWYREHRAWWERIKGAEYRDYYDRQYAERLAAQP